jgi:nucleotide-binding universal stress UspA family protein
MAADGLVPMIGVDPQSEGGTMKRVLIATDGSPAAAEAVAVGVELAAEHDAELFFVHVVPALDVVPAYGFGALSAALPHEPSELDRTMLVDAAAVAAEHGIVATTVLLLGNTVDEIVAYGDSHDVDLIVVGSRGHGAIAGALLGSVSRGILAESKRPVLIVRAAAVPAPAAA